MDSLLIVDGFVRNGLHGFFQGHTVGNGIFTGPNYLPDHMQRIEEAARCLIETGGCKPVFINDGLLGNMAWEN